MALSRAAVGRKYQTTSAKLEARLKILLSAKTIGIFTIAAIDVTTSGTGTA
jgi:hypothetical protein